MVLKREDLLEMPEDNLNYLWLRYHDHLERNGFTTTAEIHHDRLIACACDPYDNKEARLVQIQSIIEMYAVLSEHIPDEKEEPTP